MTSMTTALCLYAALTVVPILVAARSYHAFTLDEIERELARRIAEEEDDEVANDNDPRSAA